MSKETLQHTMRSKVRVFEDGGIRLLRKGQKGLIHAIFSRFGLVLVLLVLQFGALFSLMRWFSNLLPHYLGGTLLVTAAMMVYLLNQDMNNSVRIPWLVVTALAPVLGVLLFCYTKEDVGHRMLKKRLLELEGQTRGQLAQDKKASTRWTRTAPARLSGAVSARTGRRLPGVRKHAGDLFPQRRSQVRCAAAPAGKRHPVHFSGILHH
ncbi:PLD nuclease N-terminal domain-containing protein [Faecalibacterium prausnitzii]|uniref:PLD nuclease N-terminal domain-containing protein n=1 Tax=Faecalibacterium prausnitzii TaxID=853 RepID=UPI001CBAE73E|nr:PLD nuclease N-terminal domain-containing protein [Faecalibacterium prausnitzii]